MKPSWLPRAKRYRKKPNPQIDAKLRATVLSPSIPDFRYWAYVQNALKYGFEPLSLYIWREALNPKRQGFDPIVKLMTPPRRLTGKSKHGRLPASDAS
jgi:hypothetical protein